LISELLTFAFVCGKDKPKMNILFVGEPKSPVILRVHSTILLPKRSAIRAKLIDKKPNIQALK
jgi:hypothetical protein